MGTVFFVSMNSLIEILGLIWYAYLSISEKRRTMDKINTYMINKIFTIL